MSIQTTRSNERHETQPAGPPKPEARLAESPHYFTNLTVDTVINSQDYQDLRATSNKSDYDLFCQYTRDLADNPDAPLDQFERSTLSIVSHLGDFVRASQTLVQLESYSDLTHQEKDQVRTLKEQEVIPFNGSIKELINDNPNMNANALAFNLANAYDYLFSQYDPSYPEESRANGEMSLDDATRMFQNRIYGMRHELAGETILAAAGVDYDTRVGAQDDRAGNDLFVNFDGEWFGIDFKGTITGEQAAHLKHADYLRKHPGQTKVCHAVWTGLKNADFTGTRGDQHNAVSIPFDTAHKQAALFLKRIEAARSGELTQLHVESAKKMGRSALNGARR